MNRFFSAVMRGFLYTLSIVIAGVVFLVVCSVVTEPREEVALEAPVDSTASEGGMVLNNSYASKQTPFKVEKSPKGELEEVDDLFQSLGTVSSFTANDFGKLYLSSPPGRVVFARPKIRKLTMPLGELLRRRKLQLAEGNTTAHFGGNWQESVEGLSLQEISSRSLVTYTEVDGVEELFCYIDRLKVFESNGHQLTTDEIVMRLSTAQRAVIVDDLPDPHYGRFFGPDVLLVASTDWDDAFIWLKGTLPSPPNPQDEKS